MHSDVSGRSAGQLKRDARRVWAATANPDGPGMLERGLRQRAWRRWQAAAGPWRGWAVCHVLASPEIDGITARETPAPPAAEPLTRELAAQLTGTPPTAVILDVEPIVGLHVAARL